MDSLATLLAVLEKNKAGDDLGLVTRAYNTASEAHEGQLRKSGEPYITHPVAAAVILAELGMDVDTIVAALLHDVAEDTQTTVADIKKQFGQDIAALVDGVTKLGKIPFSSREEQQAENIRKMLMAMALDPRVIIIKLADRLHNMRTIDAMPAQKRRDKSLETMEVFAPIAHRLGIKQIQEELEDISLRYLDPIAHKELTQQLAINQEGREVFLNVIKERIQVRLNEKYPGVFVEGRVKSVYGIYRKVYMQGRGYDEIYDIYAVRIIVDTIEECYNILGEIHDMFRPIPNRFKDYISMPKPNKYQSLHTTVLDKEAVPFEVQIRTWDMHHTAELGIAAHWKYKEAIEGKDVLEGKVAWVRQILENQNDSHDAKELLGEIKTNLAGDEVYVFTPKGDTISLPPGSTVIDFAYGIHSEVGNRMVGAKIDGRMVSLDTKVETGQVINIITTNQAGHGPSRDWIGMVKTSGARSKIRGWFKREKRDENIIEGKAELERECKRNNLALNLPDTPEFLKKVAKAQHMNSVDDFYAAIGYGGIALSSVMPRLKDAYMRFYKTTTEEEMRKQLEKTAAQKPKKASSGVIVEGLDGCLVKFAKCCNPLPGDEIIGYVTRGFGVSVHKKDCVNVKTPTDDPQNRERWARCEWAGQIVGETFKSTVDVYGKDRPGLLVDVSVALNNLRVPVYALTVREQPDDLTAIQITFGAEDLEKLRYVMATLGKISGISRVERAGT